MAPPVKKTPAADSAAILAALAKDEKVVKETVNQTAPSGGFATNEEIIEAFGIRIGSKYTAKCRLSRVVVGLDKNSNPYFSFYYQVVGSEGNGLTLSRYIGIDKDPVKKKKAYENIAFEFQKNGYETEGLTSKDLFALAAEATKDKGGVMVQINGTKDTKNPKSKTPMVWINAQRPYDISEDSEEESEEDTDEEEVEEEETEEEEQEEESEEETEDEEEVEEEEESEEEEAEYDEEDPSTWVGYSAKVKPDKVPTPIVCVIQSFDKKKSQLTVLNEKTKKTYTIYPDGIISWVNE